MSLLRMFVPISPDITLYQIISYGTGQARSATYVTYREDFDAAVAKFPTSAVARVFSIVNTATYPKGAISTRKVFDQC